MLLTKTWTAGQGMISAIYYWFISWLDLFLVHEE